MWDRGIISSMLLLVLMVLSIGALKPIVISLPARQLILTGEFTLGRWIPFFMLWKAMVP